MAVTDKIKVTHVLITEAGIEVEFLWNDVLHSHVFENSADIVLKMGGGIYSTDIACFMIFSWWLSRSPDATDFALIDGKEFEFDFSKQNAMKLLN